ncbi:hypothetical protein ILUMI_16029 [Ignelater luminosus]|uniref:Uncharacterized protein n=1 Tax=Ignelater luminosus TaxID=2038154 RepID=A0A8K0G8K2_IGNLU|nr:hypothetical protein ILUMI_16029 [Ignelater luminosus]
MVLELKVAYNSLLTIIASYGPNKDALVDAKEQFYENLHRVMETIPGGGVNNHRRYEWQSYGEDARNDNGDPREDHCKLDREAVREEDKEEKERYYNLVEQKIENNASRPEESDLENLWIMFKKTLLEVWSV